MNIDFGRDVVKCDMDELNTPPELTDPVNFNILLYCHTFWETCLKEICQSNFKLNSV